VAVTAERPSKAERVLRVEGKGRSPYSVDVHPVLGSFFAKEGLTDAEIASRIGISRSTLFIWKAKHREFAEALRESKDIADAHVEAALYRKALSGDTTACIFYLCNRKPDRWKRNGPEIEIQVVDRQQEEAKRLALTQGVQDWLEQYKSVCQPPGGSEDTIKGEDAT
jgi:transposase-like protein